MCITKSISILLSKPTIRTKYEHHWPLGGKKEKNEPSSRWKKNVSEQSSFAIIRRLSFISKVIEMIASMLIPFLLCCISDLWLIGWIECDDGSIEFIADSRPCPFIFLIAGAIPQFDGLGHIAMWGCRKLFLKLENTNTGCGFIFIWEADASNLKESDDGKKKGGAGGW